MHTYHTMHKMVPALGPRTQDSGTCYYPWPIILLPPGLNQLLSIPWLGREAPPMEGWGGPTGSLQVGSAWTPPHGRS